MKDTEAFCKHNHKLTVIHPPFNPQFVKYYCKTCKKYFNDKEIKIVKTNMNESGANYTWEIGAIPHPLIK